VVEDVEETGGGGVALAEAFADELGVVKRQDALRPGEAHEVHGHFGLAGFLELNALDFAGREGELLIGLEPGDFTLRRRVLPNGRAVRRQAFQQTHGLEELEGEPFLLHAVAHVGVARRRHRHAHGRFLRDVEFVYTRIWRPALGAHLPSTSFLWRLCAVRRVKEFIVVYSARKRSITAVKR